MQAWEEKYYEREDALEEGRKIGRSEGLKDGQILGRNQGLKEGEDYFAALTEKLIRDSRLDDLARAVNDKELRATLYQEYGIEIK